MRTVIRAPTIDITTHPRKSGVSTCPACVAVPPWTLCTNSGMKAMAPNIAIPTRKTTTIVREMTGSLTSESGRIGSTAWRSSDDEASEQDDGRAKPEDGRARVSTDGNQQRADSREEQRRTQPVDLYLPREARSGIRECDDGHAAEPERHIQIEDPTPGQRIGDVAADERAGDRGDTPDTAEERLGPGALRQHVELAHDGHAHRDDCAGAESLNRPAPRSG